MQKNMEMMKCQRDYKKLAVILEFKEVFLWRAVSEALGE
jgi:hypothetical protein